MAKEDVDRFGVGDWDSYVEFNEFDGGDGQMGVAGDGNKVGSIRLPRFGLCCSCPEGFALADTALHLLLHRASCTPCTPSLGA